MNNITVCKRNERLGEEKINFQGSVMKIIEYNNANNIIVEFQDEHKIKVHNWYCNFAKGSIKNPYAPSVFNVGIIGIKYPIYEDGKNVKEYEVWYSMLRRCFDKKFQKRCDTYQNSTCCNDWLLYENFYEWLHSQPNFNQWLNGNKWAIDKDILVKGNKIYSPDTCCLVSHDINCIFIKSNKSRGTLPIGVKKNGKKYMADCNNLLNKSREYLGTFDTPEEAFQVYKEYKENLIKQVAQEEYDKGNITEECYDAMMNYEVEITD